ncbi:hypothetical protein NMG60_11012929 [Bertholletia excelsa]
MPMVMVSGNHSGSLNSAPLKFLQLTSMAAVDSIGNRKLKIKLVSKRIEADHGTESCEVRQQVLTNNGYCQSVSVIESRKSEKNISSKLMPPSCDCDCLEVKSSKVGSLKRGLQGAGDGQREKRQKMDRRVTQQCSSILKQLMTHPAGWVFKEPVDPVKLNIPDYFSIISEPMDLGTINVKLADNKYSNVEEFAADVRLTFSNAMLYNPPDNNVHHMAKKLNGIFNSRWKSLESKWNSVCGDVEQEHGYTQSSKNVNTAKQNRQESAHLRVNLVSGRIMSAGEKQKLKEMFLEVLRGKMPQRLQGFLEKIGFKCQKEVIEDLDALDDKTLWELKRIISSLDARAAKAVPTENTHDAGQELFGKAIHQGTDIGNRRSTSGSGNVNQLLGLAASRCSSCGSLSCQCSLKSDNVPATSSDLSSERSLGQDHLDASRRDSEAKSLLVSHMSRSDPDSDGAVSALDEEHTCSSLKTSITATNSSSREVCSPLIDIPLSPKKALRAAMLKTRFAGTILKAKQKTLLDHGDNTDPMRLKQEKERLEKQQREEQARIEAQIKEAEAASRLRAESELKMQREREREAARLALQKMERTVEIDCNLDALKALEMLSGSEPGLGPADGSSFGNPLERLGLFIKDDYMGDDDEEAILNGDGEEGEIF